MVFQARQFRDPRVMLDCLDFLGSMDSLARKVTVVRMDCRVYQEQREKKAVLTQWDLVERKVTPVYPESEDHLVWMDFLVDQDSQDRTAERASLGSQVCLDWTEPKAALASQVFPAVQASRASQASLEHLVVMG
jgi:hypothetical protein